MIRQGFKPAQESRLDDPEYQTTTAEIVTQLPYLDASQFPGSRPACRDQYTAHVRRPRAGFDAGFFGPPS